MKLFHKDKNNLLKKRKIKKFFVFLFFFIFTKINFTFATDFHFDITDPPPDLIGLIIWLFILAVIIGALILVVILIKAGIIYLTSIGNPNKTRDALTSIKSGLLGIGILIASVLFLITLNPELLRPRPYIHRVPTYIPPPLLLPPEEPIKPPQIQLMARAGFENPDFPIPTTIIISDYPKERRELLKVATGEEFNLFFDFEEGVMIDSCRSLGVRSVHPIDVRFELDERNIHEGFFEVWQANEEEHWWGWRIEKNNHIHRYYYYIGERDFFFKKWKNILFHLDHWKPNKEGIERIMRDGGYNEMSLQELFGPDRRGCRARWRTGFGGIPCSIWERRNYFEDQEALIRLEQIYGRLPYYYVHTRPEDIFYYVAHPHNVLFIPERHWEKEVGHHIGDYNLFFDYPGVYTFKMECVGPGGTTTAETSVAVFEPPEVTVTTPTFTTYPNQQITVHFKTINAETCKMIKPRPGILDRFRDWFRDIFTRDCRYKKDEALKTYIFGTAHAQFGTIGSHEIKIRCEGPGGTTNESIWIEVIDPPDPDIPPIFNDAIPI